MKEWLPASFCVLALWSIWGFLPKITTKYLPPRSVLVYEVLGALLLGIVVLATMKFRPAFHIAGSSLAILTGVVGFGGGLAYLYAASKGPISLVSVVTAMYPAIVVIAAYFFLGETLTVKQIIGFCFAIVSIVLLAT